jgi:hypothetical protein
MQKGGRCRRKWLISRICGRDFFSHKVFRNRQNGKIRAQQELLPTLGRRRVILCGKKIGYAAIRELLGGNTRQGIGPSSAYCRVLPDIAA